jgi:hypothetical protein
VNDTRPDRPRLHQLLVRRLGLDQAAQRRLAWLMETFLVGLFFVGLYEGNTGVVVNTAVALGVTQLVPVLERDYGLPMNPALTLWITTAVFLHAFGTIGFPWSESSPYRSIAWWDHLTHALSSSVVGAVGYATARAIDLHDDRVNLPPRFMFAFILLTVVSFGVFWEVLEFTIGTVSAAVGGGSVLTQYGLEDTMLDLVFDVLGALFVAVWGTAYLTDVVGALVERLDRRRS